MRFKLPWRSGKTVVETESYGFLDGAYRLHREQDIARYTACLAEVFPDDAPRLRCFGSDWLGRQFALDTGRIAGGEAQVALLDPTTGEHFEIPCSYREFHEVELLQYPNEVAEYGRFRQWLSSGVKTPGYGECVAHRVPLYLGGSDTFDNFEISDLEVHWSLSGQLRRQVRDLPHGTPIGKVEISDD